ncbi:MAG: DMT family transporter [Anaerolineae bacterium]
MQTKPDTTSGSRLVGTSLVAVSAIAFGTLPVFARYAFADGMDALSILFVRFSLAAIIMLVVVLIRGERLPRGSALYRLVGMGAVGYVAQTTAYLTALEYASAGLVAFLLYLYPVFVALLAALVLGERFTVVKGLALVLALAGASLTVGPMEGQVLGILLAIAAATLYSIYIVVGSRVMKDVPAVQSSTVIFAAAGVSAGALMVLNGPRLPSSGAGWGAMAAMIGISTILSVVTFLAGLERIGPTNAALVSMLEPVVTVLLATWVLNETLPPLTLLGGGLILMAVLSLTRSEVRRARTAVVSEANPRE